MTSASTLFRTDVQHDVVRALLAAPPGTRTAADLARLIGRPESSVARAVRELVADGVLSTTVHGRRHLLSPDLTNPYVRALRVAIREADAIERERDRDLQWWQTMPELARSIAAALERNDTDDAMRTLLDGVNQIPLVAGLGRLEPMIEAPGSIGDERWDALLAGTVRHHLHRLGRTAPAWTRREPLPSWWWPVARGARAVYTMQNTPAEIARLGIWFDARNLTTA
jgi:DNA-binding Lrp family transcriptional regulator